jgi:hypothetical protein
VALWGACSQTTNFGDPVDGGLDAQIEEDAAAIDGGFARSEAGQAFCAFERLCACSDGKDNDLDDRADGFDNECTGPFDDDEATFRVNDVREQSTPKCSDCFFDGNPGPGDDRCDVSRDCTFVGEPSQGGSCKTCDATPACVERCTTVTPNGCDCFGCCNVLVEGTPVPIRLVSTCTMALIREPRACPFCVINDSCFNPCETCEICPGRTLGDLPLSCNNAVDCGMRKNCTSSAECLGFDHCSQGCCVPILL